MTTYHLCLYVAHTRVALAACSRGIYGVKHIMIHAFITKLINSWYKSNKFAENFAIFVGKK